MSDATSTESSSLPVRSLRRSHAANLEPIITRITARIAPIRPLPDGAPHPSFPLTLLHYRLLTEDQLDSMAAYYHQSGPSPHIWANAYPASMNYDEEFLEHIGSVYGDAARHRVKQRKFGNFIGLRGCETPVSEIDEKMRWEERRARVAIKSPSEFAFRGGFKRW